MNSPGPGADRREREKIINRFEDAWQTGTPPRLESYCPPLGPAGAGGSDGARLDLLRELLKVDLEYQWKRTGGGRNPAIPTLDQYCDRYPELRACALLLEIIGEEYRVRQRWGDRPQHAEYLARHGSRHPALPALLQRIDAELAAEIMREGRPLTAAAPADQPHGGKLIVPPTFTTVPSLLAALRQHQLLTASQLQQPALAELQRRCSDPRALARELIGLGWLTAYQVNQLFQGRGAELAVGAYLLLERLGEGGAGQVFKARHLHMNRTVALKLIRQELLTDREIVNRFQREVHALSQVTHPHVVQAFDAGPAGANFYLAMEYVEGIDLARLVKRQQPLPAAQACDYIWQAALGFQHLHEHGLVHRDVKPSNLLVTGLATPGSSVPMVPSTNLQAPPWGVVKILDLGLARLHRPIEEATAALTADNSLMMGTLDYMAPEQALDFHQVDIRADIYSLGCAFYYLLTGKPPFPDCTLAQKLHRHQQVEPAPVEQFRSDVPPAALAVLRRMMAKRPEDRFQTPGEAARALAPLIAMAPSEARALVPSRVDATNRSLVPVAQLVPAGVPVVVAVPSRTVQAATRVRAWVRRWPRRFLAVGVGACLVLALFIGSLLFLGGGSEEVFLSDLQPAEVKGGSFGTNGFLNLHAGYRAVVEGRVSAKGLLLRVPDGGSTRVTYRLGKRYRLFKTAAALDDQTQGSKDTYRFSVIGDGKVLWESRPVQRPNDVQAVEIAVRDIELLELVVSNQGGHGWLVVWFDPKLTR